MYKHALNERFLRISEISGTLSEGLLVCLSSGGITFP